MSSVNVATPHRATLSLTGLPPVTNQYTNTGPWASVDGWSASAGASISPFAAGLYVTVTGTAGSTYISHASTSGTWRRVRALVRLGDPEGRPMSVRITDQTNDPSTSSARLVSGVAVWLEAQLNTGATLTRIYVDLPAGDTSRTLIVEEVIIDHVPANDWWVRRTDANGTAYVLGGPAPGPQHPNPGQSSLAQAWADPDASGNVTFVDDEASLVGSVTWFVEKDGYSSDETLTATLTQTGHAVLHRVHDDAATLHDVTLVEFSGVYEGRAQPLPVLGASDPALPTQPFSSRRGTIVAYFPSLDTAEAVADDVRTGEVMQLRQPASGRIAMDAYLVGTTAEVRVAPVEDSDPLWELTVTYLETGRGAS